MLQIASSRFESAASAAIAAGRPDSRQLLVEWACSESDVRAAQRLRHLVFVLEMGARQLSGEPGLESDRFDPYCEHLLVRDADCGEVIGTYRLMTPDGVRGLGGSYADTQFDLSHLRGLRSRTIELGRSCVHPAHRHGGVIRALWSALFDFMGRSGMDVMMGCASIPLTRSGTTGPEAAAAIWAMLSAGARQGSCRLSHAAFC